MVVFYLRNSRLPDSKIVPITVSLTQEHVHEVPTPIRPDQQVSTSGTPTGSGFPNLFDQEGETIWLLIVAPPRDELDKDTGQPIPPQILNLISQDTVHLEIEAAIGRIGSRVDWGTPLPDTQAPQLKELTPPINQVTGVSIYSDIVARLEDPLPAAGIDLSTLNVTLNDFTLISGGVAQPGHDIEFFGNVFDFTFRFVPIRSFS